MSETFDPFARHRQERSEEPRSTPSQKAQTPPAKETQKSTPAQLLLDWLQRWPKSTVYTRDILIFGPNAIRNRKSVIDATETLVRHGWLVPQKTNQSNWRQWQIVRKPIVHPSLAD